MSKIHVVRRHEAGLVTARTEIERVAARMRDDHGAAYAWNGNTLHFSRGGLHGQIAVTDLEVKLTIRLGLLFAPMRHQIETRLVEKIDRALARYHAGQAADAVGSPPG
ncbi:MAG: hypothetical protein EA400_02950 [Chromatiaceae bacterium]|nr:MAG: hypothetical protein EA400_02950 [Chromatiaceae bacterium]